jgi:hypothetical protein
LCEEKGLKYMELELVNRLRQALTAGNEDIFRIISDPSMDVLRALLKNPLLEESHLLVLLKRRDLPADLLKEIYELQKNLDSHRVKVALVRNKNTPASIVVNILPHLHLFELVDVCGLPGVAADHRIAAERAIIRRLPVTPLGNKLTLARRGTACVVGALLKEGDSVLMDACLSNPRIRESEICMFVGSQTATAETLSAVARHPRWKARLNVKLALLKNRKIPQVWFTLFLPTLPVGEIRNLLATRGIDGMRKNEIEKELKRRGRY